MPPAMPKTPERNEEKTTVAPIRARTEGAISWMSLGQGPSVPHLPSPRKDSQPAIVTAANAAQPRRWWQAAFSAGRDKRKRRRLCRSCQRTVDHLDRVPKPVHRCERAEARALLLAEQHLIEHVEPIECDTRLAVFALDLSGLVEERLAPTDFVDHLQ